MSVLFAYASFALACVLGVTYVLLFKEIKAKQLGFFYARLPSLAGARRDEQPRDHRRLDLPDGRRHRSAPSGRAQVQGSPDPRVQAMSLADPKILVALVSLGRFIPSRSSRAKRDRLERTSRRVPVGASAFAVVLLNFVLVGYFLTKSHNF